MTESFDEDNAKGGTKASAKQTMLVKRGIQVAAVAAVAVLYYQLMPGGLLAETGLGHAVQNLARAVARSIATVRCPFFVPQIMMQAWHADGRCHVAIFDTHY